MSTTTEERAAIRELVEREALDQPRTEQEAAT
jgi:hypothetical protein